MKTQLLLLGAALVLALPTAVSAQGRMPHKDGGALGVEVGAFPPRQDGMTRGPAIEGDSATKLGGTILDGVEFFTSKTFAVKGEARYHVVAKSGSDDPSGLALTIGVKSYF